MYGKHLLRKRKKKRSKLKSEKKKTKQLLRFLLLLPGYLYLSLSGENKTKMGKKQLRRSTIPLPTCNNNIVDAVSRHDSHNIMLYYIVEVHRARAMIL